MTPRTDLVAIPEDATKSRRSVRPSRRAATAGSRCIAAPSTRSSVWSTPSTSSGCSRATPLPIRPVAVAPASRTCGDLLVDMQRERRHPGGRARRVRRHPRHRDARGSARGAGRARSYDEDEPAAAAAGTGPGVLEVDGSASRERRRDALRTAASRRAGRHHRRPAGRAGGTHSGDGRAASCVGGLEFDVLQASPTRVERILIRAAPPPAIAADRDAPRERRRRPGARGS